MFYFSIVYRAKKSKLMGTGDHLSTVLAGSNIISIGLSSSRLKMAEAVENKMEFWALMKKTFKRQKKAPRSFKTAGEVCLYRSGNKVQTVYMQWLYIISRENK